MRAEVLTPASKNRRADLRRLLAETAVLIEHLITVVDVIEGEADDEPNLGAIETRDGSQERWAIGDRADLEIDILSQPHDHDLHT